MKTYENYTPPPQSIEILESITCDLCGSVTTSEWKQDMTDIEKIRVLQVTGYDCQSGGQATEISFDICPDCFENRLIPWLKSQGAEPTIKESDW